MITLSKVNVSIFLMMFFVFVFSARIMTLADTRVIGFEYIVALIFYLMVFVINSLSTRNQFMVRKAYLVILGFLLLLCLANYFIVEVPVVRYLQGTFFSFLFAIHFVLYYNVRFTVPDFYFILRAIVLIITVIGIMIFAERLLIDGTYQSYSLRGVKSLAKDSAFAATLLNINIIFSLILYQMRKKKLYLFLVLFSFLTIAMLLFIKALFVAIIICIAYVLVFMRGIVSKYIVNAMLLFFVAGITFFGKPIWDDIVYKANMYFGPGYEKIPRNALYLASFEIAKDYFPFGSGQGTFGSYPVGMHYSQIYYDYDLNKVHGLSPDDALGKTDSHFIFDTYWSSIIGEMGFIGFFLYLLIWFYPAIVAVFYLKSQTLEVRVIAFGVVMVMLCVFIESIASPLPGQLQFIHIYSGLGAVGCRLCRGMTFNTQ